MPSKAIENSYTTISRPRAWLIWLLAASFYFYQFFLEVSPGVMKPELSRDFGIDAEQFGWISAWYLYIYGLMQIPVGILVDKFGPRRLLTIAAITCALGSLVFGHAELLWQAKLGRVLMGFGGSFAVVSCFKLSSMWFPLNRFSMLTGLVVMIGMLGALSAQGPLAAFIELFNWRDVLNTVGIAGFFLAALIWLFVKDNKVQLATSTHNRSDIIKGLKFILTHRQIWLASIYASLMFMPTLAFGALWAIPFLTESYGLTKEVAGSISSFIFIGWALGGPTYGYISDTMGKRNLPMYFACMTTIIVFVYLMYATDLSIFALRAILFGIGFFSSGFLIAFAVARESSPLRISGTAIGFVNSLNTLGGAAIQPVIGKILTQNWQGNIVNGVKTYTLVEYQSALMILPILLTISIVFLVFIKETNAKQQL